MSLRMSWCMFTCSVSTAVCVLLLTSCGWQSAAPQGATRQTLPPWTFEWETLTPLPSSLPAVFASNGYAVDAGHRRHSPQRVIWVAITATSGLALIQLDPADHYESLAYFANEQGWTLQGSLTVERPQTPDGPPMPEVVSLPPDTYQGASYTQAYAPHATMQYWLSPHRTFVFALLPETFGAPPTGARSLALEGHTGWLAHNGPLTTVFLKLPKQTLVFSGTGSDAQIERLALESVAKLARLTYTPPPPSGA